MKTPILNSGMRVTVYNTETCDAICYYDVEAIVFDRKGNVVITFFNAHTVSFTADEYTDIDCKQGDTTICRKKLSNS